MNKKINLTSQEEERFRRSNKTYREQLSKKLGYTVEEIADFLGIKTKKPYGKGKKSNVIPIVHNVVILDNSGSMAGFKFVNAYTGVKNEIELLKNQTSVKYIYSLFNFDYTNATLCVDHQPIGLVELPRMSTNNGTPLYLTIVRAYEHIIKYHKKDINVLLKIFTDGRDEHSKGYLEDAIKSIQAMKDMGVTVTFVGTDEDVKFIINELKVDASNTLVHDNTSEGVKIAFDRSAQATMNYTTKVAAGEDVKVGFFLNFK
jgi:hypothetical protein